MELNQILSKIPFFKNLSEEDVTYVITKLRFKKYAANQSVCRVDEIGDEMFIIVSGKVRICITNNNSGEEEEVAKLDEGNYFGEMALLTEQPRTASVYTTETSEMFVLDKKNFHEITDRFPAIQIELSKIMSLRLRQNLAKAMEITKKASLERTIVQKTAQGELSERKTIVDIMAFCDKKGLTGDVEIISGGQKGMLSFDTGQIISMSTGNLQDDEALDEMVKWKSGNFIIKPSEVSFDELIETGEFSGKKSEQNQKDVLVASESLVIRRLLERRLKESGYNTQTVKNIVAIKEVLETSNPKYLVLDMKFDDGDALEAIPHLRKKNKDLLIFVLTEQENTPELKPLIAKDPLLKETGSYDISEIVQKIKKE